MVKAKACKICKKIYDGNKCPSCDSKESIDNFKGRIIVMNPKKSELATKLNIKEKGNFAIKVR
jgi:DNA-directed RNA polymerase subunit E"